MTSDTEMCFDELENKDKVKDVIASFADPDTELGIDRGEIKFVYRGHDFVYQKAYCKLEIMDLDNYETAWLGDILRADIGHVTRTLDAWIAQK